MESLYLFYGEEKFLIEDSIKKIKKSFNDLIDGINFIKIDDTNIDSLLSNIETPCFGYDKKLIIVKNSGILKKEGRKKNTFINNLSDKIADYISDNLKTISQDCVIVFVEDEIEKNSLFKVIEANGKVVNFAPEKLPDLIKRIRTIANAYKVQISDLDSKYLLESCGTNLQDIINELRKLIEYVGENGVITQNEIDLLTTKQIDSEIFDLTDNLGKKNIKAAMDVFYNLVYQREPVQKILVVLYNHFKKLYLVKIAVKNNENIADVLKLKPNLTFLISKYKQQANYFTETELRKILDEFTNLDYNYKIGLIDINVGIESILCRYCGK